MKTQGICFVLLVFVLGACNLGSTQSTEAKDFAARKQLAELMDKKLKEVSGMAASRGNAGLFWVHNDSGNEPEIYLIDDQLNIRLTVKLEGVENRDWEDIAVGPGPVAGKQYVYVGDIGDNDAVYPYKYIYRFEEPLLDGVAEIGVSDIEKIVFKLEDQVKDTESLMIDHQTKNVYVISKREQPVYLYELTAPMSNDTLVAKKLYSLPFKEIVAADYTSVNGDVLIKNYQAVYYWKNEKRESIAALLKSKPARVPYDEEPQGESIAWAIDGAGFYTLSEKKKKKPCYLYFHAKE
ncbi:hypothetical protein [Pseudochryseolinea flava]|uniref:PE-PGRS family protein n=1 Tax=Pseudochryseolinea flava TaxID=2059302 RepID=A0A364Y6A6_9BACT|nr:hypothetical protein [Pseudochryseolinea flava]RAW02335.1 hypothetical protein DQQ10_07325 [Pseudochryseolinea flava]